VTAQQTEGAQDPDTGSAPGGTLSIRHLSKAYRPGVPVLDGINLEIGAQGLTAVIGPSGTGKSTLIRCINRLVEPTSGEVWFEGQDLTRLKGLALRRARARIGMVFQEYNLVERLTVIENVLCGTLSQVSPWRAFLRRFPQPLVERAFDLIDAVGLDEGFARRRADQLSGGQRQRVGIARALMQAPGLVLADEPTSSLDPKTSVEVMDLMARLAAEQGVPIIVNIHNVELARRYAQRIIGMSKGKVIFDGPPAELTDADLRAIYGGEDWLG
jgi:phosphonate transport system ATP-binding protein